jgi:hypothetical protein
LEFERSEEVDGVVRVFLELSEFFRELLEGGASWIREILVFLTSKVDSIEDKDSDDYQENIQLTNCNSCCLELLSEVISGCRNSTIITPTSSFQHHPTIYPMRSHPAPPNPHPSSTDTQKS